MKKKVGANLPALGMSSKGRKLNLDGAGEKLKPTSKTAIILSITNPATNT